MLTLALMVIINDDVDLHHHNNLDHVMIMTMMTMMEMVMVVMMVMVMIISYFYTKDL